MTIEQFISNLSDIKSRTAPPYYLGRKLRQGIENLSTGYRSTINGDGIETCQFDGVDGLAGVSFILLEYKSERGIEHEMDNVLGVAGPDKVLQEIVVK